MICRAHTHTHTQVALPCGMWDSLRSGKEEEGAKWKGGGSGMLPKAYQTTGRGECPSMEQVATLTVAL